MHNCSNPKILVESISLLDGRAEKVATASLSHTGRPVCKAAKVNFKNLMESHQRSFTGVSGGPKLFGSGGAAPFNGLTLAPLT